MRQMDITVETLEEIDEALKHAYTTRQNAIDSKKPLVDKFIDDLLDSRLEITRG
jgi:hypothetical protein